MLVTWFNADTLSHSLFIGDILYVYLHWPWFGPKVHKIVIYLCSYQVPDFEDSHYMGNIWE